MIEELTARMAAAGEELARLPGPVPRTDRVLRAPGQVLLRLAATGFGVRLSFSD